jgi:hypothetical protein
LVEFSVGSSNADRYEWDFDDGILDSTAGDISHVYTSPGMYQVVVTGCMENCLPLNTCVQQTLELQVIDTTSSVRFMDATDVGVSVFPNPAHALLLIDIASASDIRGFEIVDMHGLKVRSGDLRVGMNSVELQGLSQGVYAIVFDNATGPNRYRALRVTITQ